MRFHDKHLVATMDKEAFHVNFHHFMELDGYQMMEIEEELGVSAEEVKIMRKKISRT